MNNKQKDQQTDQYMCYEDIEVDVRHPESNSRYAALSEEFRLVEELIKLRVEKNYTQTELAEKVGIKQAALARLESGRTNPTFMTLARIAEVLDKKLAFV